MIFMENLAWTFNTPFSVFRRDSLNNHSLCTSTPHPVISGRLWHQGNHMSSVHIVTIFLSTCRNFSRSSYDRKIGVVRCSVIIDPMCDDGCETRKVHHNFCCTQIEYLSITGYYGASIIEVFHRIVSQSVPQHEVFKLYLVCLNNFSHGGGSISELCYLTLVKCKYTFASCLFLQRSHFLLLDPIPTKFTKY